MNNLKRAICAALAAVFFTVFAAGCARAGAAGQAEQGVQWALASYKDIPGVTEDEIRAIEALKARGESFVYGANLSSEAFYDDRGGNPLLIGYTGLFCEWLGGLFGIPFKPAIYAWDDLLDGLENGGVDFTGDLTASAERRETYFMTDAIAERLVVYYTLEGGAPISDIEKWRPVRYSIQRDTTTARDAAASLEPGTFEIIPAENADHSYDMLKSGEADAAVLEQTEGSALEACGGVEAHTFYPLIYSPVSLSARDPGLEPVISVVQKALENGAMSYLTELYSQGMKQYTEYKLYTSFTPDETAYLAARPNVALAAEYDNYPISFYNEYEEEWQGIAFDVLEKVKELTGIRFTPANSPGESWSVMFNMLETGQADMVTELIPSAERRGRFLWPETPLTLNYPALISKSDYRNISVNEILYTKISLEKDAGHTEMFHRWFPRHMYATEYPSSDEAFAALERGDADMVMSSEKHLLAITNYNELSGYKANIIFDFPFESKFGFNINEAMLCSIVDKTLALIDTETITGSWTRRTYDYQTEIARIQRMWLAVAVALSMGLLAVLMALIRRVRRERKRLGLLVAERTNELSLESTTLTAMLDATPDLIFCKDTNSRFTRVNKGFLDYFGLAEEDIIGKSDAEAFGFAPEVEAEFLDWDKKVLSKDRLYVVEEHIPAPGKEDRLFETIKTPLIVGGHSVGIMGISRDITARKEAETHVREAEERLRLMLADVPLHVTMWDKNNKMIDCGPELVRELGFNSKQECLDGFDALTPEFQADGRRSRDVTATELKKAFEAGHGRMLWQHYTVNGDIIPYDVPLVRMKYKGESIVVGYGRDLREEQTMTAEIERRGSLLDTVNRAASILLSIDGEKNFEASVLESLELLGHRWEVDRVRIWRDETIDGKPFYVNSYSWFSEHSEAPPAHAGIKIPRAGTSGWREKFLRGEYIAVTLGGCDEAEREFLASYGMKSAVLIPLFLGGNFWGFFSLSDCRAERVYADEEIGILRSAGLMFASAINRSEQIALMREADRQQAEAEAANSAKTRFLTTISHEMRTPMNAIMGIAEIQMRGEAAPGDVREALGRIYSSGGLLLSIINDLLDLSKIEAGKMELMPVNYEAASVISDAAQLNVMQYESKPIEFELEIGDNIPITLYGDEMRIRQILNNLLSNAFKYTAAGKVKLSVFSEPGEQGGVTLVFRVQDTGQGMSPEQVGKLFDEYTRFNLEANRTTVGAGLGMSITKHLVYLMDGSITVESELGKGSEFTVRLPQKAVSPEVISRRSADSLSSLQFLKSTHISRAQIMRDPMPYGSVLVVDDVETNIYVARLLLQPYGLRVDSVTDGFEAVRKIEAGNAYDLVLMDHMMPVMDGLEATKLIRGLGYEKPIVALTANAVAGQSDIFLSNGFDGFISKPVDLRELNATLNTLIRDRYPREVVEAARRESGLAVPMPISGDDKDEEKLKKVFASDAAKAAATIRNIYGRLGASFDEEDAKLFTITTHSMKTALAIVGEAELSNAAKRLEEAGRGRDLGVVAANTPEFLEKLEEVIAKIAPGQPIGSEAETVSDGDMEMLREKAAGIREACEGYDKKAAKAALAELEEMAFPRGIRERLDAIAECLLHSEFEEAGEIARELGV